MSGLLNGYDGMNLAVEYADRGARIARRYVHGPGVDEPLVWYEGSGTADRRYLHADERGSVVAVTDSAGGTIGINRYDEYGAPASGNIGRFQYTGQTWLPELGMYNYKARIYDPRRPGFMQPDPIGYDDGMNLYAYVGGDPVNFTDPTGMRIADPPTGSRLRRLDGTSGGICGSCSGGSYGGQGGARSREGGGGGRVCVKFCGTRPAAAPGEILVTALPQYAWVPSNISYYVADGRYRPNPYFDKPEWADWLDYGFVAGPPLAAAIVAGGGALLSATVLANVARFAPPAKHLAFAGGRHAKFNTNNVWQVRRIVYNALTSPGRTVTLQADGRYRVVADLGRAVGSKGQTSVRVVVSPSGRVITAFPGK